MPERPAELRHQQARLVAVAAVDHPVDGRHDRPFALPRRTLLPAQRAHPAIFLGGSISVCDASGRTPLTEQRHDLLDASQLFGDRKGASSNTYRPAPASPGVDPWNRSAPARSATPNCCSSSMPVTSTFDWRSRSRETTASNSLTVVASRQTCRNHSPSILTISGQRRSICSSAQWPAPKSSTAIRRPWLRISSATRRKQLAVRRGLLAEGADDKARIEPDFSEFPRHETDTVDQRLRIAALGVDDQFKRVEADVAMVAQWQAPSPCARRNRDRPW